MARGVCVSAARVYFFSPFRACVCHARRWGCTWRSSGCCLMLGSTCRCQVQLDGLPLLPPRSLSLILLPVRTPLVEARRQDCYLWDRHQADLRLSSLLPCGSHWKQMVSKQPVMFTAAAIKDKSPTTHSLRSPTGSHRGLQTAAWGGGPLALRTHSFTHTYTHTHTHLELAPTLNTIQMPLLSNTLSLSLSLSHTHTHTRTHTHTHTYSTYRHKSGQARTPNVLRQPVRTCYIYCN